MAGSDLDKPFRGVRKPPASDVDPTESIDNRLWRETRDVAGSYSKRMPLTQLFSHVTAARLLRLRLPVLPVSPIDVAARSPSRAPRLRGVRGHTALPDVPTRTCDGLLVTTPVATWCALASMLTLDDLIVMGDGLVRRLDPQATVAELAAAVDAWSGRPGAAQLRGALREIRARTDSPMETRLRLLLVRAGFPEPEVNGEIRNEYGAFVAFGDLVYRKYQTVIEYDGGQHRTDVRQFDRDIDRLDDVMELGFRVIRVNKSLMARQATLFGKVQAAFDRVELSIKTQTTAPDWT